MAQVPKGTDFKLIILMNKMQSYLVKIWYTLRCKYGSCKAKFGKWFSSPLREFYKTILARNLCVNPTKPSLRELFPRNKKK